MSGKNLSAIICRNGTSVFPHSRSTIKARIRPSFFLVFRAKRTTSTVKSPFFEQECSYEDIMKILTYYMEEVGIISSMKHEQSYKECVAELRGIAKSCIVDIAESLVLTSGTRKATEELDQDSTIYSIPFRQKKTTDSMRKSCKQLFIAYLRSDCPH
ncbi:hypothetical protein RF11_11339 [Thelohanellus kitauei]|uniref:Uncharacterized protein n=1 Tax=Thelohanellus kitauei TaxID=669202 RepID=A0A0C2ITE2_THEKT|nr:hypothetical protein RF11_11339 [Thelohanellus kitauei]